MQVKSERAVENEISKRVCRDIRSGNSLSGKQPDELSMREDDLSSEVNRLSEEPETVQNLHEDVPLLLLNDSELRGGDRFSVSIELRRYDSVSERSDPEPDSTGNGEEDRTEEVRVVVTESLDGGRRGECS